MNRWGSQSGFGAGSPRPPRGALPFAVEFGHLAASGAAGKATGLVQ